MLNPDLIRKRVQEKLTEQKTVVRSLLAQREQLQASLFVRYGECGKENCVCRSGQRHGPYYVLSARGAAGSAFTYLDAERVSQAERLVGCYREFRRDFRRLKRINLELVELLRRYQDATAQAGGRRMGVTVQKSAQ